MGICGSHPRLFAFLSIDVFKMLMLLWKCIPRFASMPVQVQLLIIALISKATGPGKRPIGLIATLVRLMNRWLRMTYGESWRVENDRSYFFGIKGRGSIVCAWRQSAFAEYARIRGRHSAAALFDIVKAYENV